MVNQGIEPFDDRGKVAGDPPLRRADISHTSLLDQFGKVVRNGLPRRRQVADVIHGLLEGADEVRRNDVPEWAGHFPFYDGRPILGQRRRLRRRDHDTDLPGSDSHGGTVDPGCRPLRHRVVLLNARGDDDTLSRAVPIFEIEAGDPTDLHAA